MKTRLKEPQIFYGLHFAPGIVHYSEKDLPGVGPFTILVPAEVAKDMDPTMQGRPVLVNHSPDEEQQMATGDEDGWVSESFFNEPDGFHWAKFTVITEDGLAAIRKGWTLSNGWDPMLRDEEGEWHAIPYTKVATAGKYTQLAIVETPRYQESKILTADEFKAYNEQLRAKNLALRNEAEKKDQGEEPMFNFFKNEKKEVKFDADVMTVLPKSKKLVNVQKLLNEADEEMEKNPEGYAKLEDKVKLHDGRVCNVGHLLAIHKGLHDCMENEGFGEEREAVEAKVLKDGAEGGEKGTGHPTPKPEAQAGVENETEEERKKREEEERLHNEEEEEDKKKKREEEEQRLENARRKARELKNARPANKESYEFGELQNMAVTPDSQYEAGKKLF